MNRTESPAADAGEEVDGPDASPNLGGETGPLADSGAANPTLLDGIDAPAGPPQGSPTKRIIGSVVILVGLIFALWYPLPDSAVKRAVPSWWVPATEFLGLQQNWAMFAPDPPGETVVVEAVVTDASGKSVVVRAPVPDPVFGSVYSERWRKWQERIRPPIASAVESWPKAARWFARRAEEAGMSDPVRVELRRNWVVSDLMEQPKDHSTHLFVFFTYDVKTGAATYLDAELNPAIAQQQQQGGTPANNAPTTTAPGTTPAGTSGTAGAASPGDGATSTTTPTPTTAADAASAGASPSGPAGANGANP